MSFFHKHEFTVKIECRRVKKTAKIGERKRKGERKCVRSAVENQEEKGEKEIEHF